jgi:hypothetical protein
VEAGRRRRRLRRTREDEDYLWIDREQTFAHEAGTTACDIVTEQAKVRCADFVLFQYPMWWFGLPNPSSANSMNAGATRFRASESHSSVSVICHL